VKQEVFEKKETGELAEKWGPKKDISFFGPHFSVSPPVR
jgi:hypothetical protein